jgi:cellulose synthase (UDP-forming)
MSNSIIDMHDVKQQTISNRRLSCDIKTEVKIASQKSSKDENIFIQLLSPSQKIIVSITVTLLILYYIWLWLWIIKTIVVNTKNLFHLWLIMLLFIDHLFHILTFGLIIKTIKINPKATIPNLRVAMIVTKVASESFEVLKETLLGMIHQKYPYNYDIWLANEEVSTPEILDFCNQYNIKISCRYGVPEYHQLEWPKRTKCKEGNLRYYYDINENNYDVVFQFDSDHIPSKNYLMSCMPAFADSTVSYIAMPSINDRNTSWIGKARLYLESYSYGPYQASFSYTGNRFYMPNMTGSHYGVRVKDLKKIGGLGPELDEDLSTTMMFASNNFKGVYSLDTIASGEDPSCFEDAMKQEFQWSRSAAILFCRWRSIIFPKNLTDISLGLWLRLLLIPTWYLSNILWLSWLIFGPIFIYYTNLTINNDNNSFSLLNLLIRLFPITLISFIHETWCRQHEWCRPKAPIITLIVPIYKFLRIVWVPYGLFAGLIQVITGKIPQFKVTPKGENNVRMMSYNNYLPLLLIILIEMFAFSISSIDTNIKYEMGIFYLFFIIFLIFCIAYIIIRHYIENHKQNIPISYFILVSIDINFIDFRLHHFIYI